MFACCKAEVETGPRLKRSFTCVTALVLKINSHTRQICEPEMSLSGVCLKTAASAKRGR